MKNHDIEEAIYKKYIAPTQKKRGEYIGIEIEMPIVNLSNQPVIESVAHGMAEAFRKHFSFKVASKDSEGEPYNLIEGKSGDSLSFDCSYSNLEFSMGKRRTIFEIKESFDKYYAYVAKYLKRHGHAVTGMGVNPNYNINHNYPIPSERYRMLLHYLRSYKNHVGEKGTRFHARPDFGTFTSASQVQLDVDFANLIDTLNVFGLLEPYKILLFANSPSREYPDLLCSRNIFWEESMHGYNKRNVGLFNKALKSVDDLVAYIKKTSIYCVERDGKYFDFDPVPVSEYFKLDRLTGRYFDGKRYRVKTIVPQIEDIKYLRTFKLEDLTYRGTVEYRSACCQPIKDSMTVAAFHTGLIEKLPDLKELLEKDNVIYGKGYDAANLQHRFSARKLPSFADERKVKEQLLRILALSESGLQKRGFGEEVFLKALFERAEKLTNPAKELLAGLGEGKPIKEFVERYAVI
ncbi:glutamylcysteine synthetase [bacterium]|nr:glutamylcysteine synthetase [bacterium]